METRVYTKQSFLKALEKEIDKDEIIILSGSLEGTLSVNKKRNVKKVTFGFAADAFKTNDCVGHFVTGKTPVLAFAIACKDDVSDNTLNLIKGQA